MPEPFLPTHFHEVAEFLLEEDEDSSDPTRWADIQDARLRSAISRSYYAVFLRLKERLEGARRGWKMPRHNVHKKLGEALEGVLPQSHKLVMFRKRLWGQRKSSDYELGFGHSVQTASDRMEDADAALTLIDGLSADQLSDIALLLSS